LARGRLLGIVVACGLVVVGTFVFEPWERFVDQRVDERYPRRPSGGG
jgi:hypothetical protein